MCMSVSSGNGIGDALANRILDCCALCVQLANGWGGNGVHSEWGGHGMNGHNNKATCGK